MMKPFQMTEKTTERLKLALEHITTHPNCMKAEILAATGVSNRNWEVVAKHLIAKGLAHADRTGLGKTYTWKASGKSLEEYIPDEYGETETADNNLPKGIIPGARVHLMPERERPLPLRPHSVHIGNHWGMF